MRGPSTLNDPEALKIDTSRGPSTFTDPETFSSSATRSPGNTPEPEIFIASSDIFPEPEIFTDSHISISGSGRVEGWKAPAVCRFDRC